MDNHLTIEPRFCGPINSGNGGYVCGLLSNYVDYTAEVTLRQPPPLNTEMDVVVEENELRLMLSNETIASVTSGTIDFEAPQAPDFHMAVEASKNYLGFKDHPYPYCFVCGPNRNSPDALCIFPGKSSNDSIIAAPWEPDKLLADTDGNVKNEFVWAALDCPGGIVVLEESKMILLGRMTAKIKFKIQVGEKCVVIGWLKRQEGRKLYSGTAIYTESKGLCAVANAIWIDTK
ncbi:hypothetical protein HCG49_15520 [Arenibacter sp. 6A1]|uniref:hypothetical protein n=1 Tax=Arenibacter sp. 6A1 TaxID=2720391 RepID=UPI001445AD46|nr:hypothetical protein [Arenibacter sp. 6A1]NKI27970.1 hypothetical protein [Arenibacter sp. 6A1]